MNLFYSLDETIKSYLDGEKNGLKYIKKKTFDKAVDDGKLTYNISGKTVLKKADPDNKEQRILRVSENETYALSNCKLTQLVGYIPVGDGVFVEYRRELLATRPGRPIRATRFRRRTGNPLNFPPLLCRAIQN